MLWIIILFIIFISGIQIIYESWKDKEKARDRAKAKNVYTDEENYIEDLINLIITTASKFYNPKYGAEERESIYQSVEIMIYLFHFYLLKSISILPEATRNKIFYDFTDAVEDIVSHTQGNKSIDTFELCKERILSYTDIATDYKMSSNEKHEIAIDFIKELLEDIDETSNFGNRKYIKNHSPKDYKPIHTDLFNNWTYKVYIQEYIINIVPNYLIKVDKIISKISKF